MIKVDDFSASNDAAMVQAAIDFAAENDVKSVQLIDRDYSITKPILIKEGVSLHFSYGSRFIVTGSFRVIELQRNAALFGAYIAIDDPKFNAPVIFLDGKNKFYNSWFKAQVKDAVILNWSGSHKGVGIYLYANGSGHEISFMNFQNVKCIGLKTAVHLQAVKAQSGFSYINANSFNDLVIDDCVNGIQLFSSETIPNECSGNTFKNIQFQSSSITSNVLTVNGQFNDFDGMVWDLTNIPHNNPIIRLTKTCSHTLLAMKNAPLQRIEDKGKSNKIEIL